jgi:drug/metabolite transporter (DMT)-like permease
MPSKAVNHAMTRLEWGMLLALSILWGASFFFVGVAIKELPLLTIVALRVGLAALILNAVAVALGMRMPRERGPWLAFLGMGLLNNVAPFCLIVWGQAHIASGLAAILNATTPLATVVVAHVVTDDEKLTGGRLAGVLFGLAGVAVMIGPEALKGLGGDAPAEFAVLLAAISYAFAGVYGRRFARMGVAPLVTATGQVTASTLVLAPITLLIDRPWTLPAPSLATSGAVIGVAALSTALAYVLYFRILATAGATNLLLVTFLIPVSAILLGSFILGERLDPRHFLGMALIGAGLASIDGRAFDLVRGAPHRPAKRKEGDRGAAG